ncbi:ComF family protein [Flavobacteriales bacterium]|nr:ComF family protein [Flavobacteriales bacterium]
MGAISHLIKIGFPNNCITCNDSLLRNEKFICSNCFFFIPKGESTISKESETNSLLGNHQSLIGGGHLFNFDKDGKTQQLLHELKYNSNIQLGTFLGELIGAEFKSQLKHIDFIIPVPLHKKKLYERGYNQSEVLSNGINNVIEKKISIDNLIRTKYTETQTKKNKLERIENIKNAFEINNPQDLEGKSILLIDDVITTGSTLAECINSFDSVKNIKITVMVLAKAVY